MKPSAPVFVFISYSHADRQIVTRLRADLQARGMNAYQLQQLIGHEKITTSQEYVHLSEADLRLAMERTSL